MIPTKFGRYFAELNMEFESKHGDIVMRAYLDPNDVPTGPGGTITNLDGSPIRMGQTWTREEALELYAGTRQRFATSLHNMLASEPLSLPVTQFHFDALGTLAWNIGLEAFRRSTVFREYKAGNIEAAARAFLMWTGDTYDRGETPEGTKLEDLGATWLRRFLGLFRRQAATACLFMGYHWATATSLDRLNFKTQTIKVSATRWEDEVLPESTDWSDILAVARHYPLEEKPTTQDLNENETTRLANERQRILITPGELKRQVPLKDYEHLADQDKQEPVVKDVRDSQRGKAVGKEAVAKTAIGAGSTAILVEQVGLLTPILTFVEKFAVSTIVLTGVGVLIFGVVMHYWGKWQMAKGRKDATTVLG